MKPRSLRNARESVLVICPTARDRIHFARPEIQGRYALEFRGTDEATHQPGFDALSFLTDAIQDISGRRADFQGVVGIDDFPACMLAAIVAETFGFAFPSFESLFLCQHKYYSRLRQRDAAPKATPNFHLVDLSQALDPSHLPIAFPVFVKPVKSYLSILARRLENFQDLARAIAEAPVRLGPVAKMFDALVGVSTLDRRYRTVPASALLLEEPLTGHQVTLDGYAYQGRVVLLGVVDSVFFPGTLSFARFEYPSRLPPRVQERMGRIAERVVASVGLDRTFFNIEFFYRQEDDSIRIIEINGRMASQFAPLYRMLHGIDMYAMQLDMVLGRDPGGREVWRRASSCGGSRTALSPASRHPRSVAASTSDSLTRLWRSWCRRVSDCPTSCRTTRAIDMRWSISARAIGKSCTANMRRPSYSSRSALHLFVRPPDAGGCARGLCDEIPPHDP